MSEERQNNNPQDINIFNNIEEEEQTDTNEKTSTSIDSSYHIAEEEDHHEINKNISEIFRLNVNEAMAKKSLTPSMTLIISIEADPNQEDSFWSNKLVLNVLSPDFIIVRLSQTKNVIEILQFSSIFVIKSVPSLYIFGPFSQGISYAWPERYPTPSEFVSYVNQQLFNRNQTQIPSTNFSDLIVQSHVQNPSQPTISSQSPESTYSMPTTNQQQGMPTSTMQLIDQTSISPYSYQQSSSNPIINQQPQYYQQSHNTNLNNNDLDHLDAQNNDDLNLLQSTTNKKSNSFKKSSSTIRKSTTRISVQLKGQHTNFEFSNQTPVGDVVRAIEKKFGRSYELYVPHLRRCIIFTPEELQRSVSSADLAPSALIILRSPSDPGFSSNTRENIGYEDDYFDEREQEIGNDNNNNNNNSEPYRPPPSNADKQFTSNAGDDAVPSLDIEENLPTLGHTDTPEVVPSESNNNNAHSITDDNSHVERREEGRGTTDNRCGWSLVKKVLSILNPFGNIEEVEDFFETKEFRT